MPAREGAQPRVRARADAVGVSGVAGAAGAAAAAWPGAGEVVVACVAAAWADSVATPGGSSDPGGSPVAARRQDGAVPDAASAGRDVRAMR
ncbi:hypothetical protein H5U98_30020 [Mycolicibacterium boenickei]|uniref:Uncharacterized protein n=1 Tax=Mycolicibacterium boenickei TaxID=146017 RepID=A0AAX2ZWY1_9MYCO|nr:hypothetical protein [Mycolicibacterium boenickei]UNB99639.1 hypothetical protein H5U98_30020 [Mycolicibacterium boenickei]BBX89293.1 hypothetical protein MBOE_09420 [Mycolicibacterium boenickei]